MTTDERLLIILKGQSPGGAFPSVVHRGASAYEDWNGFTTAQVLRALASAHESHALTHARDRALDFLLCCQYPDQPGAFGFYPKGGQPTWMAELPADADDTAVMALELSRHGRLDREAQRKIACKILIAHRLIRPVRPAPPWIRAGVFLTWLKRDWFPNPIDCCVNANVAAFLAYAGLGHLPGFREACAMVEDAVRWAGQSWSRARTLTPFYPHPGELLLAVRHAVRCGAGPLEKSLSLLCELPWAAEYEASEPTVSRPFCGTTYGRIVWTSSVLQAARSLRGSHS